MESLEEDLTCSVCYSLFRDPCVLPCSHTFCRGCLDSVLHASGNFSIWRPLRVPLKCPNCRSVAELPSAGVGGLPANVSLRAIVEKYQREGRPRTPLCPQHPLQPLNVYCVRDRQLICGLCLTVGGHQGHAIDDLETAFARERGAAAGLARRLEEGRWAEACARVERERARCGAQLREDRDAAQRFFQGLQGALERKRLAFLRALDAADEALAREVDPLLAQLKEAREEQEDLVACCRALEEVQEEEEEEEALAFLQKLHTLRERVETLLATPLPQVRALIVRPRVGEVLEAQWGGVTLAGLEHGPVPPITCCPDTHRRKDTPPCVCPAPELPRPSPALLLALLAMLVSLCLTLIGWSSLGGSGLYQACAGVVRDATLCLASLAENLQLHSCCLLSSLRDTTAQSLASLYNFLSVW
ncbi:tripartite motif-containing protein 59 [Conger conger]|uniref:tripartite motif-containing protein 59 n=1 Tax=Conger conger TaxID=82655 RepID=UPI002A5A918C|nr:tripartite motif-containing protein 59 [Conger conger]